MLYVVTQAWPESDTVVAAPFDVPVEATRRVLTAEEKAIFDRDGYVVLKNFFSKEEIAALVGCMERDPLVMGSPDARHDSASTLRSGFLFPRITFVA